MITNSKPLLDLTCSSEGFVAWTVVDSGLGHLSVGLRFQPQDWQVCIQLFRSGFCQLVMGVIPSGPFNKEPCNVTPIHWPFLQLFHFLPHHLQWKRVKYLFPGTLFIALFVFFARTPCVHTKFNIIHYVAV